MANDIKVLIVDDEEGMCKLLKSIIHDYGYEARSYTSAKRALSVLKRENFDIAIVDIKMPEMNGLDFLKECLTLQKEISVLMITAYGSIENAIESIKIGAYNYITKPFQGDEIIMMINQIIERKNLLAENIKLRMELDEMYSRGDVIAGKNGVMKDILQFTKKIAITKYNVLITGESGTGKEVIAKYIHRQSPRKDNPFVPVQCSLFPLSLLESELFGYKKGAFTGATADKMGIFEEAESGTIFLDEIGDIGPEIQGKLLRFLQDHEIRSIGDNKTKTIDARLIAATNKNLEAMVRENTFREDLYYRLKVISINLPPLRERREDIPLMVHHFLEDISRENSAPVSINKECMKYLVSFRWPGNVRELRNCIETAAALCDNNSIEVKDIQHIISRPGFSPPDSNTSFKESKEKVIQDFECGYITTMLLRNKGNITASAKEAKMDKKNFWDLMKKYNVSHEDYKNS